MLIVSFYIKFISSLIQLNVDTHEEDGVLDKIKKDRGYNYEDVIEISPEKLPNYEEKVYISIILKLQKMILFFFSSWKFFSLNICILTK